MTEPFVNQGPITVALPVADRRTTFTFYAQGLGLGPFGDLGEDGVPEPLSPGVSRLRSPTQMVIFGKCERQPLTARAIDTDR